MQGAVKDERCEPKYTTRDWAAWGLTGGSHSLHALARDLSLLSCAHAGLHEIHSTESDRRGRPRGLRLVGLLSQRSRVRVHELVLDAAIEVEHLAAESRLERHSRGPPCRRASTARVSARPRSGTIRRHLRRGPRAALLLHRKLLCRRARAVSMPECRRSRTIGTSLRAGTRDG